LKTLKQIKESPATKMFDSYLAKDWQTILLKALDVLNRLEKDRLVSTRHISRPMAKCVIDGEANLLAINCAISDIQEILDEGQGRFVTNKLSEVLEVLFAVRANIIRGGKER